MSRKSFAALAGVVLGIVGCGGGETPATGDADPVTPADGGTDTPVTPDTPDIPDPVSCEDTGSTYFYAFNSITVDSNPDMAIAPGFNLDDRVSDDTDIQGCNQIDYTSPPPDSETGVDNQLGPILTLLASFIDVQAELDAGIAAGQLLVLVELSNVDDKANDDCVTINVSLGKNRAAQCNDTTPCAGGWACNAGVCSPTLGEDGHYAPGQTFDIDGTVEQRTAHGRIADGRLIIGSTDLDFAFPVSGGVLALNILDSELRMDVSDEALEAGLLGGSLNVDQLITAVLELGGGLPEDLVRSVFTGQADLNPPACDHLSVGLEFTGISAVKGEVLTE